MHRDPRPVPRSLVLATEIDVLPPDVQVWREIDHLVVRSPDNPAHWWGNFLVFDDAPEPGDGERWEAAFAAAFADMPGIRHTAFAWDQPDGAPGEARAEFAARGYDLEVSVGLVAAPQEIRPHPRASRHVQVRALDPAGDEALWEQHIALQLAEHDGRTSPAEYERFVRARQRDRRALFAAGRGAWYVALEPDDGAIVGACGVVATDTRGRYQAVVTAAAHRGRGIASRLVADAGRDAARRHGLSTLVIVADAEYHALGIYESLGFRAAERTCAVERVDADA